MNRDIRILFVDDDAIVRDNLPPLLNREEGITVVAIAQDGAEALTLVGKHHPDVVLLDVDMPIIDGPKAAALICSNYPRVAVVMLTAFEREETLGEALKAGARGFLTKDMPAAQLAEYIRKAHAGEKVVAPRPFELLTANYLATVEDREKYRPFIDAVENLPLHLKRVYARLGQAQSTRDIIRETKLSEATVRSYISDILTATGCRTRGELGIMTVKASINTLEWDDVW